jgi:choline transport protein
MALAKDASLTVPRAMIGTICICGLLGFPVIITLSFIIQSIELQVVDSTAVDPFIAIIATALNSNAGATAIVVIFIILNLFCAISGMAAASRQAWAFARDDGFPFRRFFTNLRAINGVPTPVNAILASLGISIIMALLNLGGTEVFDSLFGLGSTSASLTYMIGIGSILWRRLFSGKPLPSARWSLGRWGLIVNLTAFLFVGQSFVVSFFPLFNQVTPATMNWAVAVFVGVAILAVLNYFLYGRKVYKGPVVLMRNE